MIKGTVPFLKRWRWIITTAGLVCSIAAPLHAAIALTDDTGRQVRLAHPAKRIVSLAPGLTELVFDAGAGRRLVGAVASAYNFPPAARKVPSVGDAFHMDMEKIAALHPDLVLAWRGSTPKRAQERLRQLGFTVATLGAERLRQIAGDLLMIGRATGRERAAKAKANAYLSGLAKLRQAYARRTPVSVFYEISAEPLYTVSGKQSISQIISLCGGRNIFADLGPLAPAVSLEAVLVRDPQAIITAGQGRAAKKRLDRWRRWPKLAAVNAGNLFQVKPGDIARATPRILKGGRKICEDLDRARRRLAKQ